MRILNNHKGSTLLSAVILLIILATIVLSFAFWLAVQSKGITHKKLISKAEYYGESGVQKGLRYIQENPNSVQWNLLNTTTNNYILKLEVDPGTVVDVSIWNAQ